MDNDKAYQEYLNFQEKQGSDEIIVVMISTKNAYSKKHIQTLNNLHKKIDNIKNVNATFSLVKAQYPLFANNKMYLNNIFNENRSEKAITNLLKKLPAVRNNLVADNNTKSFFYIQLKPLIEIEQVKSQLLTSIKDAINSEITNYKITGSPILIEEINKSVSKESFIFAIVVALLISFLLLIVLPKIAYLPIALASVIVPVCLLFGLYVILGFKLNMISMLIPTVLMVYTVSDVIHIINIYHLNLKNKLFRNTNLLITKSLYESLKPCFYTTITTVIGYLALCLSPLPVFKITGFFTFIGLFFAFIFAFVITAIGFSITHSKKIKKINSFNIKLVSLDYILIRINHLTSHYKKSILLIFSVLFFAGIIAAFYVNVNSYSVNLLHNGKVKNDLKDIEKILKGSIRLSLDIQSKDSSSLFNKNTLELIDHFQQEIKNNKELSIPISIIDYKHFFEKRFGAHQSIKKIKINSFEHEKNSFFKLVSDDFSRISINVNSISMGSKQLEVLLKNIETSFENIFKDLKNIRLKINGSYPLYVKLHDYIILTQLRSFGSAFLLSFLVLFFFIKNFRTSTLALVPNLFPLLLTVIIMVIFDIPLGASNAMIAPIMIGIVMDDTIHLIHKYKLYKTQGFSVNESMDKAMIFTGRAIFSTTITLVLGFSVVMFSRLTNMREFGLLCALTILFALIADTIVLPALIKTFDK